MRYISDDGKVFNTEQECCEHEQGLNEIREEMLKKQKLELERQNMCNKISCKYKELTDLLSIYTERFPTKYPIYFAPLDELLYMLSWLQ